MFILRVLRTIVVWGWSPIIIMVLALVGHLFEWSFATIAFLTGAVLVIGLVIMIVMAGERQLEIASQRLRHLAGYFGRRFTGDSSLSIFAIIDTLFNIDNPPLWDWARACDMAKRVFNGWYESFLSRLENETRSGRFTAYSRVYLNELWLANSYYYEFVEQFHDIAQKVEIPPATVDQYNRFVVEYNTFVENFRDVLAELKKVARTEIEPPSTKLAGELSVIKTVATVWEEEKKPDRKQGGGYYSS